MLRLPRLGCSMIGWKLAVAATRQTAHAALRVAGHRVLDLDHVGAPVGEHRARRGREGELRHLQDADAFHRTCRHVRPPFGRRAAARSSIMYTSRLAGEGAVEYNPYSSATQHNPFPVYRWLRDEAPVYHNEKVGLLGAVALRRRPRRQPRPDTFLSGHGMTIEGLDAGNDILINKDQPEHTWHRRLVSRVFTPMAVAEQEANIRTRRAARCSPTRASAAASTSSTTSRSQLPIAVICEMLGIPEDAARARSTTARRGCWR